MNVLYLCILDLCNFIIDSTLMQYCINLEFIKETFETINNDLEELAEMKIEKPSKTLIINDNCLITTINKLIHQYESAAKISKDLSDFYSQPVLFCMPFVFMGIVCNSYIFIKTIFIESTMDVGEIANVFYIFTSCSAFFLLTIAAQNTISEVHNFSYDSFDTVET